MAKVHEVAWARTSKASEPFEGRSSLGCVWYRTDDGSFDVIRVGSTDTTKPPKGFEVRRTEDGESLGVFPTWESALQYIDDQTSA